MRGMDRNTGRAISGTDRLRQSITVILTTMLHSRVMRRTFGSELFELIDAPLTSETIMRLYAASAGAIAKWEPEFQLRQVSVESVTDGTISLLVVGLYIPSGEVVTLDGILIPIAA